ncbi:MAG: oligosaccharide flippase family protein [Bacteroidetes bacterium]|nr:oligosaccharide flippase family protein [Bacteroidota bacterium]
MIKKDYINIFSLYAIQISNALLPLLIFPYILKIIGAQLFSRLTVTEGVSVFVLSLVIYSFEINGVSKIIGMNLNRDKIIISKIFNTILFTRLFLFLCCIFVLFLVSFFLEDNIHIILMSWMLVPLSYIFQSLWFYQGMEKNIYISIFTIFSRLLCFVMILIFIKAPLDYINVPIIIGFIFIIGGLLSLFFIYFFLKIKFNLPKFTDIEEYLKEGYEIFFGNMSVFLYRDFNVLLLAIMAINPSMISAYSISEKLVKGVQAMTRPMNQFFFPKVVHQIKNFTSPNLKNFEIIKRQTKPQLIALVIISIVIILSFLVVNNYTVLFDDYPQKYNIISLFLIMNLAVFFGISNFMFGSAGLNFLSERKYFFKSIFLVGMLSVIITLSLTFFIGVFGAAISFVLSEVMLLILIIKKYNIFKFVTNE